MTSMVVIVPTRGRPNAAAALIESFDKTVDDPHAVELIFVVDADDTTQSEYHDVIPPYVTMITVPPQRMVGALNAVAKMRPLADIIGFMGDDHRPRTSGWNLRVVETLNSHAGVVYGNDLLQGPNLATAVFITGDLVRRLGYMVPPSLLHLYADNFWMILGQATNLTYLSDVIIEHLHPVAKKAEWDATYEIGNSAETYTHDLAEFQRYVASDWPTERLKLA